MLTHIDHRITELENYLPELTKKPDHDIFWNRTLNEKRRMPLNAMLKTIDYPIKQITAHQLNYHGFDKTPINAYYILPAHFSGELPCLIIFHGYGGHKNSISHYMKWLIQGYAVIAVDLRGQGRTGDYSAYTSDEMGTWITKGILNKEEYYYRKVLVDAIRAIDFAHSRPEIDNQRIAIMGASMGGGISLLVAALDDRPKLVIADVPNMCDLSTAIQLKSEGSLVAVEGFLHRHPEYLEKVFETLSYFDNLNHCQNIKCRVRVSVGMKDPVCPPKPIFGVYNHITAPKSIELYPFSGHDLTIIEHLDKTLQFVNTYL